MSRHIYDLHKLLPQIPLNKENELFFKEIRKIRTIDKRCLSAPSEINICEVLDSIIKTDYFKADYEIITNYLVNEKIPYNETIASIKLIRDWISTHD